MEVFKAQEHEVFERRNSSIKAEYLYLGRIISLHLSGLLLERNNPDIPSALSQKGWWDFFGLFCPIIAGSVFWGDLSPQVILLQTKSSRQRRNKKNQNLKEGGSTTSKSRIAQDCPFQWSLFLLSSWSCKVVYIVSCSSEHHCANPSSFLPIFSDSSPIAFGGSIWSVPGIASIISHMPPRKP